MKIVKRKDNVKGITLISLVITIVIMLILAAVSINMVLGDNGIINKTKLSKFINEYSSINEAVELYESENEVDSVDPTITNQEEVNNKKYPIKGDKLAINSESTLGETIMQVENVSDLSSRNIYYIDLSLIGQNVQNNYVIDTESGKLFQYEGTKIGSKVYHIPSINLEGNNNSQEEVTLPSTTFLNYDLANTNSIFTEKNITGLNDLSDKHVVGTYSNVSLNAFANGLKFNGTSTSKIELNNLGMHTPCTISTVIKPGTRGNELIFTDYTSGVAIGEFEDTTTNHMILICSNVITTTFDLDKTNYYDGNIKYLTIVYDSTSVFKAYINGVELTSLGNSNSWSLNSNTKAFFGQRETKNTNYPFRGEMYNLRLINRKLNIDEITKCYTEDKNYIEGTASEINNNISRSDVLLEYVVKNRNCVTINDNENKISGIIDVTNSDSKMECSNVLYNREEKCAAFNGSNSYTEGTLTNAITLPCTVSLVIKPESKNLSQILFSDNSSKIIIGNLYDTDVNENVFIVGKDNVQTYKVPNSYYDGSIQYLTVVYNSSISDNELYLNGQKLEKDTRVNNWTSNSTTKTYIGTRDYLSEFKYYFKGNLYNFKIYNETLNENQVSKLYDSDKLKY